MPTTELSDRDMVSRLLELRNLDGGPKVRALPAEGLDFQLCPFAGALPGTPPHSTVAHGEQRPAVRAVLLLRVMDPARGRPAVWKHLHLYTSPASTPRRGAEQFEEVRALTQPGELRHVVGSMLSPWPFTAGDAVYEDLACHVACAFAAAAEEALGMSWGCVLGAVQVDCIVRGGGDGGLRLAMLQLLSRRSDDGELQGIFGGAPAEESAIETLERVTCAGGGGGQGSCTICWDELGGKEEGEREAARMPCGHVYHRACIGRWLRRSRVCPLCRYEMPRKTDHP